ncbi:MAG: sigma-70 family RNA polymerase sigma factor [Acidobacteria bacterium]|nr:sigma-70 family RNA polymerase sigma factor [Acidobacteriota bacterium]MCI0720181.1 sigma-70 family RNA polymerase sigma factor [Acidobacteriota bacterium]
MTEADAEIIEQARRGDPLAWEKLVVRHTKRIYNLCFRFVGRVDQAEDLTQEVFIKVFRNLSSYNAESGQFLTWVMSVGRNLLIDHYRQSKDDRVTVSVTAEEDDELSLLDTLAANQPSAQAELERQERAVLLRKALDRLPPQLKEAVILRDLEELSYEEIERILKVPAGTVKSRINRGRVELAKGLQKLKSRAQGFSAY